MAGPLENARNSSRVVLVVEDDGDLSRTIGTVLDHEGFSAVCVTNGEDALAYLERSQVPFLILLDLNMPVMTGWEFRRRQTQDPRLASIPVIIMSAHHTGVLADANGISFYLKKPFTIDTLLGYIRRFSRRSGG